MLQVYNETPFVPELFLFPNEQGVDTLYPTVKATFHVSGGRVRLAGRQCRLVLADTFHGEPGASSLKYASEAHLLKPGTDVVLVGEAHAPRGQPTESCLISVRVGHLHKQIQVFGERRWERGLLAPRPSRPEPFVRMPLVYERAYGGTAPSAPGQGPRLAEPRNPVGCGFRGTRGAADMVGQPLPNLEDPARLVERITDAPTPAGVGYVAPAWEPRKSHVGTYDEAWQTRRAPYLPLDFHLDFYRAASAGLSSPQHLQGGEQVELIHVSPAGAESFRLPRCTFDVTVMIAGRAHKVQLRLETLLLEPGEERLCLLWRGAVSCDKRALWVEHASFRLLSLEGVERGS